MCFGFAWFAVFTHSRKGTVSCSFTREGLHPQPVPSRTRVPPLLSSLLAGTKGCGFTHGGSDSQESVCNAGDLGVIRGLGWEDPLERREWQPTAVFLPGEAPGQRSLAGYRPWGRKESDTTEQRTLFIFVPLAECSALSTKHVIKVYWLT